MILFELTTLERLVEIIAQFKNPPSLRDFVTVSAVNGPFAVAWVYDSLSQGVFGAGASSSCVSTTPYAQWPWQTPRVAERAFYESTQSFRFSHTLLTNSSMVFWHIVRFPFLECIPLERLHEASSSGLPYFIPNLTLSLPPRITHATVAFHFQEWRTLSVP